MVSKTGLTIYKKGNMSLQQMFLTTVVVLACKEKGYLCFFQAQEKQSSDANTEFANMWKQLQSVSESSDKGTSLSQAASVLPNVTTGSRPIIDSDNSSKQAIETDSSNGNTAQTKIDVDSLFSHATVTQSVPAEKTGSDTKESVSQSTSQEASQKDTKSTSKVVSNDEFAALFKTLKEEVDDEEDEEEDPEVRLFLR